jgi:hypothetical protein
MGASGWEYFVPYQPNIQQALDALHHAVFARGEFYQREPFWRTMTIDEYAPPMDELDEEEREMFRRDFERLQQLHEPTTIEELIEWNGEAGTHSILDVHTVVTEPAPLPMLHAMSLYYQEHGVYPEIGINEHEELLRRIGTVSPLSEQQLQVLFGTTTPTHTMIEDQHTDLSEFRERNEGLYIVVYENEQPHEVFFAGFSGD